MSSIRCFHCANVFERDAQLCSQCGEQKPVECVACFLLVKATDKFCYNCGFKLQNAHQNCLRPISTSPTTQNSFLKKNTTTTTFVKDPKLEEEEEKEYEVSHTNTNYNNNNNNNNLLVDICPAPAQLPLPHQQHVSNNSNIFSYNNNTEDKNSYNNGNSVVYHTAVHSQRSAPNSSIHRIQPQDDNEFQQKCLPSAIILTDSNKNASNLSDTSTAGLTRRFTSPLTSITTNTYQPSSSSSSSLPTSGTSCSSSSSAGSFPCLSPTSDPNLLPSGGPPSLTMRKSPVRRSSASGGQILALTDEQRYNNQLQDVCTGCTSEADFSNMRFRGVKNSFFSLGQIITAVNQNPNCHTLKLTHNDITSLELRQHLLPFFTSTTNVQKVFIDGNPGILSDVQVELLAVNRGRQHPLWIETHETGLKPAARIALKHIDNAEYLARRKEQELNAVDTDKKWGNQQRFHQGRTVKPYVPRDH